jgi:hypothetical protein
MLILLSSLEPSILSGLAGNSTIPLSSQMLARMDRVFKSLGFDTKSKLQFVSSDYKMALHDGKKIHP